MLRSSIEHRSFICLVSVATVAFTSRAVPAAIWAAYSSVVTTVDVALLNAYFADGFGSVGRLSCDAISRPAYEDCRVEIAQSARDVPLLCPLT